MTDQNYDALFLVSFGGPEGPDDVMPYLENVLRGKNVPRERMLEVGEHYNHFGGISPINQQNRDLLEAIREEFKQHNIDLPVYWGNRNWHPMIVDTMRQMKDDGIQKALAFFTNGYSCYSGCRQYRENMPKPKLRSAKTLLKSTKRGCSLTTRRTSKLPSIACKRLFPRFQRIDARKRSFSSPLTASRTRWLTFASTRRS